jgi:hypothetical protein
MIQPDKKRYYSDDAELPNIKATFHVLAGPLEWRWPTLTRTDIKALDLSRKESARNTDDDES